MNAPWLTIHELAKALKVSVKTVRRAYPRGEIPVQRIFRFVRFDIDQVKEAMRRNGQGHLDERISRQGGRRATGGQDHLQRTHALEPCVSARGEGMGMGGENPVQRES
jgi:excisionase family DNA binding protein